MSDALILAKQVRPLPSAGRRWAPRARARAPSASPRARRSRLPPQAPPAHPRRSPPSPPALRARQRDVDVFNALDLMENAPALLKELKFGPGDGHLQYYLYNWQCPELEAADVGLVLL